MNADGINSEAVAEDEEFSAAAPPHPAAAGAGETSFGDAEAPPASTLKVDAPPSKEQEYLELARRTKALAYPPARPL